MPLCVRRSVLILGPSRSGLQQLVSGILDDNTNIPQLVISYRYESNDVYCACV